MLASSVIREARRAGLGAEALTPVGSLRRFAPDIGDVSLLCVVPPERHKYVLTAFARLPLALHVQAQTPSSITLTTARGPVRLHLSPPEQAGAALVWHTGSRAHVDQLKHRAEHLGFVFADAALARSSGGPVATTTEEEVYAALKLPYIVPELRDGDGEIEVASAGTLPQLLSEQHIRGDLHMHTTWSDGRDTIEDMVLASQQLGYEYIAITDHSERAWSSRKLAADDVPEPARRRSSRCVSAYPGIPILHGIEVDIMQDGSLDFEDELLERLRHRAGVAARPRRPGRRAG